MAPTARWQIADVQKLLQEIRLYPVLFDKRDINYKNDKLKQEIWEEVSKNTGYTVEAIKTKWKGLKDTFIKRQKAKEIASVTTSSDTWLHWDSMFELLGSTQPLSEGTINKYFNMTEMDDIVTSEESNLAVVGTSEDKYNSYNDGSRKRQKKRLSAVKQYSEVHHVVDEDEDTKKLVEAASKVCNVLNSKLREADEATEGYIKLARAIITKIRPDKRDEAIFELISNLYQVSNKHK